MPDGHAHPLFAAIYDPVTWLLERYVLHTHREYLADDLEGRILDIGMGTGAMFPFFAARERAGGSLELHGLDPDPHMRSRARSRADSLDLDLDIWDARAESLPFADDTFDAVIASMVFCTVDDPNVAVEEISRVLRPGGEFRFLEHVADEGWRSSLQTVLDPVWRRLAGGCHLTRRTTGTFLQEDPLALLELDRMHLGYPPIRPFVRGRFVHRGETAPRIARSVDS